VAKILGHLVEDALTELAGFLCDGLALPLCHAGTTLLEPRRPLLVAAEDWEGRVGEYKPIRFNLHNEIGRGWSWIVLN